MVVKLKVEEAKRSDVGRQIARIPTEMADKLGIRTGDVIQIKGKKITYAKVWRSTAPEVGPETIRIEPIIRRNANVNLDDYVEIKPTKISIGKQVTISPRQQVSIDMNLTPYLAKAMTDRVLVSGDLVNVNTGFGGMLYLDVMKTEPLGPIIFGQNTKLVLIDTEQTEVKIQSSKNEDNTISRISYEDIGGMSDAIRKVREMIELPLRHPEIFERLGIQPPKGVLLYGPPGTGKTLLARAIACETSSHFVDISGPEIMSKFYGESEGKLREIFEEAKEKAPSIIFIDEIDSIAPKREDTSGEVERRIVAQLLSLMDGLEGRGNVVVIGATNRPDSIDPALRRGGRFDRELEIGIPDEDSRLEIFQIHTRGMPLDEDVSLEQLSSRTHGFVGADLETVAKEAALSSLRRFLPEIDLSQNTEVLNAETLQKIRVTSKDFNQALVEVSPSALREVFVEIPDVKFGDIGGLDNIKNLLLETIEWPLKYSEVYKTMKAKPATGILLYGAPGTGKTMLAKAIANLSKANFISIKGPELISKWVGESEKGIREIFRKARSAAPCIIFFDEIDSIASTRTGRTSDSGVTERIVSQLLTEIDGLEEMTGVTILAATNRPDLIDSALMRPGRFDRVIMVEHPTIKTRKSIFEVHLRDMNISDKIDIDLLSQRTEGFSGAEIGAIVEMARMNAIREFIDATVSLEKEINELTLADLMLTSNHLQMAFNELRIKPNTEYNLKPPGLSEIKDSSFA